VSPHFTRRARHFASTLVNCKFCIEHSQSYWQIEKPTDIISTHYKNRYDSRI